MVERYWRFLTEYSKLYFNFIILENQKKAEKDANFQYPAKIYPGCGIDKIRKRKTKLWKTIDVLSESSNT